jgi:hypothetical protein
MADVDAEEEAAEEILMDSVKLPGNVESPHPVTTTALAVPGSEPRRNVSFTPAPAPLKPQPPSRSLLSMAGMVHPQNVQAMQVNVVREEPLFKPVAFQPEPEVQPTATSPNALAQSGHMLAQVGGATLRSWGPDEDGDSNISVPDATRDDNYVTLSNLVEYLAVERSLMRSCATLPLTLTLSIVFMLLVFNHGQARMSWETSQFLETSIRGASATVDGRSLSLDTLSEYGHIMPWLRDAFVPMLYHVTGIDTTGVQEYAAQKSETLIGFVRLTQTRGQNATSCPHLSDDLRKFYDGGCHEPGVATAFGPWDSDYSFRPHGDTNHFIAWLEVGRSITTVTDRIDRLLLFNWMDLSTQDLTAEFVFLNAEVHVYTYVELTFVVTREGYLERGLKVQPLRGDVYTHWAQIFLDCAWVGVLGCLIWQAGKAFIVEAQHGLLLLHLHDPFTWLDWLSIFLGMGIGMFFWYMTMQLDGFSDTISNLANYPRWAVSEAPDYRRVQMTLDNAAYQNKLVDLFDQFSSLSDSTMWHRLFCFWYGIVIVFRFFRGFTGQPRMGVLMQTLLTVMDFLFHFFVIFAVMMGTFALGGYVLFGEQLEGWSTAGQSISSLMLFLFGHFNYEDFYKIAPVTSFCWFWAFYISVVLVLINVVAAAMIHRYLDVRARLGETGDGLATQILHTFRDVWWDHTYEGAQKSVPNEELLNMLTRDADPAEIRRVGRSLVDRRLRDRADLLKAINDPVMDVNFLVGRGCEPAAAERLLHKVERWKSSMTTRSSPQHRLMVHMGRQMITTEQHCKQLQGRVHERVETAKKVADRIELKHAKCISLSRRIKRSQQVPDGWTAHHDEHGRRYLQHDETGLTSWTLPRNMI